MKTETATVTLPAVQARVTKRFGPQFQVGKLKDDLLVIDALLSGSPANAAAPVTARPATSALTCPVSAAAPSAPARVTGLSGPDLPVLTKLCDLVYGSGWADSILRDCPTDEARLHRLHREFWADGLTVSGCPSMEGRWRSDPSVCTGRARACRAMRREIIDSFFAKL